MSLLNVRITTAVPVSDLSQALETAGGKQTIVQRFLNLVEKLYSGGDKNSPSIQFSIDDNDDHAVQASGTVTCASAQAADTVTINGVIFTAVSGTPAANEFKVGVTDTADAASLALSINSSVTALVSGYVTATSSLGVVTIKSVFYGLSGNQTTLATSNNTRLAKSGTRLASGVADPDAQTLTF
jgi:phage tail sheath gpL-like